MLWFANALSSSLFTPKALLARLALILLRSFEERSRAEEIGLLLASQCLDAEIRLERASHRPLWNVFVAARQVDRATAIINEEAADPTPVKRNAPLFVARTTQSTAFIAVAILAAAIYGIWLWLESHGSTEDGSFLLQYGAVYRPYVLRGEVWRLITAVFLHFGFRHLLANILSLLLFGYWGIRIIGVGRYAFGFVLCGVGGNLISLLASTSASSIHAGASGAVLGTLGILGGQRIRQLRANPQPRFKTWHVVAALAALYGLFSAAPNVDQWAHAGGIFCGLLYGLTIARPLSRSAAKGP